MECVATDVNEPFKADDADTAAACLLLSSALLVAVAAAAVGMLKLYGLCCR